MGDIETVTKLRVCMRSGRNFVRASDGKACSLQEGPKSTSDGQNDVKVVGGEKANIFRTSVKKMESSPKWNEEFQWTITSAPESVLVLEKLIKGHGLTMLQVEVLSCHASLVDRQAKLEVGISVEQSTQPVDTSSRASRTRKLLEELHNEKTRLEAQALAAGEVQGTEFKLSAHGQVVSNEGASEGQAVAHENLNTENSGARHGDSTDTGKDIPEKESSPLTSMKVTPVADVRLKSSLVELFLKVAPSMPLFQGQDPRLLQNLSTKFTCLRVEKDQTIVEVDTEGHSMFFLLAGECCVRITGKVVTKLVAPCTFGEVAMLLSERRTAEVRTATDCLMFELAQQDLWNTLNEFPSAANSVYRALKLQAVENVEKNKGAMTTIESHPSALAENLDPLSALNLSDRRQRVLQWHKNYDAEDEGKKGDKLSRTSSWEDTIVPIMNVDPIEAAKKISGVSEHMVSVIKNMDLFRGAPSRAQAQVIAKLVTVTFKAGDVVIQAGTSGTCMYILDVGRVEVKVDNKRVGELGSGAFFGEVALLARKKRTATIVAIEDCKLLQLDQDSVWTVFNMFPNAFQTVKEVATKRLEKAQETMDRESALTSSKIKRKEVTGSRSFRVKFRAPFDRFTPEELGVSIRKSFVAGLTMVKATFHPDWSLPGHPKGSRSSATAHKSKKQAYCFNVWDERYEIFDSMEQSVPKASDPVYVEWIPKERMRKTFYTSGPLDNLVLCIHKVRWGGILGNTKKLELVGKCPLRLQSVLNARGRTREQSCPIFAYSTQTSGVTDQLQIGELKATIHASNDKNELFLLLVPLFDESHVNGHIQEVTDHTGKVIMFLKLRLVPATENTQSVRCTYATLIDIIGLDGSHKGQVATVVTAGCHARSRLANNSDIHWATVKSKKLSKSSARSDHMDCGFFFKVVPTFKELRISEIDLTERPKSGQKHFGERSFEVSALKPGVSSNRSRVEPAGRITIGGSASWSHASVQVNTGEDVISLIQVSIGICESHRLAPCFENAKTWDWKRDAFQKNYDKD